MTSRQKTFLCTPPAPADADTTQTRATARPPALIRSALARKCCTHAAPRAAPPPATQVPALLSDALAGCAHVGDWRAGCCWHAGLFAYRIADAQCAGWAEGYENCVSTGGVQAVAGVSSAQMGRKPALLADALAWTQTAQLMRSVGGQEETETFAPRRHAGVATVQRPRGIRKSVPLANALVWAHVGGYGTRVARRRAGVDARAHRRWQHAGCVANGVQVFLQTALSTDRAADAQLRKPTLLANALLADTLAWVCGSVQLSLASKSFRRPRGLTRSAAIRKTALLADVLAWVRAHVGDSGVQAVAGVCTGRQKDTETAPRSLLSWLTHAVQRSLSCC
ncbi:hypothetical protein GGX14DRAFT_580361 [Mycena pura]|uniref:Uncharacterized protein n=1 Tax=Mycena pura TaxID=153505 RepID=A0AAD6UL66_9AGAR|nr:hypothetical protein GGX14DRAFT_580361 [Mycena pura]